ncbi:protein kinase [Elaphomyces granulatus]
MENVAPTSRQDISEAKSLQDDDQFNFGDFSRTKEGMLLMSSAAPISLQDMLIQTYRIEHKIRHDDFSTVWLARDIKKKRDVALIMVSGDQGDYECSMQKKIMSAVQEETSNLGTNNHQVLVFPVLGPNFRSVMLNQISMTNRMSGAWQLLKALECLHNAKIVHNRLNKDSVIWGVAPFDNLNTKTKYKYIGRPKKMALPHDSWKEGELVKPFRFPKSLITDAVYLGDFGMATEAGTEAREKQLSPMNTKHYAPERFHNVNPSFASDMWSYMCVFSELYLGHVPWASYSAIRPYPEESLESIIKKGRPDVGEVELKHIVSIMEKVFCYRPDKRLSATRLLHDSSFQAVMKIYCY